MQVDIRQGYGLVIKENGVGIDKDDFVVQFYQGNNTLNFRFNNLYDLKNFNKELSKLQGKITKFVDKELEGRTVLTR